MTPAGMRATVIEVELAIHVDSDQPPGEDQQSRSVSEPSQAPAPTYRYRHTTPSAPWLWMDFKDLNPNHWQSQRRPPPYVQLYSTDWGHYPQNLFGEWKWDQVERCQILTKCSDSEFCDVHEVNVYHDGRFDGTEGPTFQVNDPRKYWEHLGQSPPSDIRLRALFVENMTPSVLQILGTRYNIGPFFFASSLNWIPSRYQEDVRPNGDHITVVLPFLRITSSKRPVRRKGLVRTARFTLDEPDRVLDSLQDNDEELISDTQAPLLLPDNKVLFQDLLSIHMLRTGGTSTVISCHPSGELQRGSAKRFQLLVQGISHSGHWSSIIRRFKDPTFIFIAMLWYAYYTWDEAFEALSRYVESATRDGSGNKTFTELHALQARLLEYQHLLRDFRQSVEFVRDTPNPAMSVVSLAERDESTVALIKEANSLLSEVDRLNEQREFLSDRLHNVISMAFTTLSIQHSNAVMRLAVTSFRDLHSTNDIAFLLTMFFPGIVVAKGFAVKVQVQDFTTVASLPQYLGSTVGLILCTSWLMVALKEESSFHTPGSDILRRCAWPLFFLGRVVNKIRRTKHRERRVTRMKETVIDTTLQGLATTGTPPLHRDQLQEDSSKLVSVPAPNDRFASPAAPWSWVDFNTDPETTPPLPPGRIGKDPEWSHYPQSLFGNWTRDQVSRSQMLSSVNEKEPCYVHKVNVFHDGSFDRQEGDRTFHVDDARKYWEHLGKDPPQPIRVQVLFVENMTRAVLQMIGTRYNVEPSFFANSLNYIPSRYQEDPRAAEDHITIVLPILRITENQRTFDAPDRYSGGLQHSEDEEQILDARAPLLLPGNKVLFQDLMALHMVRAVTTSTIISYHPSGELQRSSAKRLQLLVQGVSDSVHWSQIFKRTHDPTFLFLAMLWYALYAWDEVLDVSEQCIKVLERGILNGDDLGPIQQLHKLQAYLLHYQYLLRELRLSVEFVRDTPNPAMSVPSVTEEEREDSAMLLYRESINLVREVDRLSGRSEVLSDQTQNVIRMAHTTVKVDFGKWIQKLTFKKVVDFYTRRDVYRLALIFFPAAFLASTFSTQFVTPELPLEPALAHYVEALIGLTLCTAWLVIAFRADSIFYPVGSGVFRRVAWPVVFAYQAIMAGVKWVIPSDVRATRR